MKEITSNTEANGIGDLNVVSKIIENIVSEVPSTLPRHVTENIIDSVSFLMDSDLTTNLTNSSNIIKNR